MANAKFDSKSFNAEAFKYAVQRVPNLKTNEMVKSKALVGNADIRDAFSSQNGTAYARIAMKGILGGTALNYDGATNITSETTKSMEQGVVVVGRAKAWTERDFSDDITGVDWMDNVAQQVAEYWDEIDQDTLLSILKGVFSMTSASSGAKSADFVDKHTSDVTASGDGLIDATTLNSATNKACGANKKKFTMVFMHSDVATNLENLNLLSYLKYTDANGVQRDLALATWNGRMVLIDDAMPVEVVGSGDSAYNRYTTYVLGDGAFWYENIGAKVPYEVARDPKTNGGEDTLYTRQRKVFAPVGLSYEKASQVSNSPTNAELETAANWTLVHSGEATASQRSYYDHKAIPICRIISKG